MRVMEHEPQQQLIQGKEDLVMATLPRRSALVSLELIDELRRLVEKMGEIPSKKKLVKPQRKRKPKWTPSPYPIQRWRLGTTKIYSIDKKEAVVARVKYVNCRMKVLLHLPNHYLQRTVLKNGRLYVEVERDR